MNKVSEESVLSLPERHARILALLQQNGSISVTQLAEQFRVSEVTIRKDLSYLEQQKKLYRTHGSAILLSPYISDRHVSEKEKRNVEEKQAIGKAAAALIEQNDSIIIASGTTMTFLAREIRPAGRLTVITASVPVTQILSQNEQTDVIQLGGITRSSSVSVVGPFAEQMLRSFNCSKLFIGVDGIDPDFGLTTTNMLEASLNRAMIDDILLQTPRRRSSCWPTARNSDAAASARFAIWRRSTASSPTAAFRLPISTSCASAVSR